MTTSTTNIQRYGWVGIESKNEFTWLQFTNYTIVKDDEGDYSQFIFRGVNPLLGSDGDCSVVVDADSVEGIYEVEKRPCTFLSEDTPLTIYGLDSWDRLTSNEDYANYDKAFEATELYAESVKRDEPYDIHANAKYPL